MNVCITTTRASHRPRRAAGWRAPLALAHYRWVKEHGKKTFTEYGIAVAELARLESPAGRDGSRSVASASGPAQGLLVAVGLKTNRRSKVWCQAVEGAMPAALMKTLERELGKVEPVTLKAGPAGFGLKFALNDKTPSAFPSAPERWTDAAESTRSKTIIPPDDLFRILWPD